MQKAVPSLYKEEAFILSRMSPNHPLKQYDTHN